MACGLTENNYLFSAQHAIYLTLAASKMRYTILNKVPISGSAPEFFFGDHQGQVVWIEFINQSKEKWYGVFESGKLFEHRIKVEEIGKHLNVLIDGNFYRIDIDSKNCITKLTESYILDFVKLELEEQIVFVEQTGISVLIDNMKHFKEMNFMINAEILTIGNGEIEFMADRGEGKEKIKSQLPINSLHSARRAQNEADVELNSNTKL